MPANGGAPVLEVRDLVTRFRMDHGIVNAVSGVSYSIAEGEALGIVGESGSGKTVGALSLMGLVPPPGVVEGGEVRLRGQDLLDLSAREWRAIRAPKPQNPKSHISTYNKYDYYLFTNLTFTVFDRSSFLGVDQSRNYWLL